MISIFRILDFFISLFGLISFTPLIFLLTLITFFETGSPFFIQNRVGKNKKSFRLIKFRTMYKNTASVATHLVDPNAVTPTGMILRRTKLDELPQLWNVLMGDMSIVGPRPGLLDQIELIQLRENKNVFSVRPGITGLAQINGIDMSTPKLLAKTDAIMIEEMKFHKYFKYIFLTIFGHGQGDKIKK